MHTRATDLGRLLRAAIALVERENPGAELAYSRRDGQGLVIVVRQAKRVSVRAAHALGRASQIEYVRFRAGSVDGLLGNLEVSPEAVRELEKSFVDVVTGSFEATSRRRSNEDYRRMASQRRAVTP